MSANIKDTLKKKVNQAQNKAIFDKYGTPDVVATIKGKKVEYGNQTDNKKTQNNNRPKKSAVQTLASTKKAQVTQQQKAKSKLGTDKKGYIVTDSNKVMQNYANKTGSYDVNRYKKDTFDKQRAQEEKAKKIVNNIKKGYNLNSFTKKTGQAAKNTGKFLTDFDYRNEVGTKALMGAGTALSQFSKGALKTVENWGDAARSATDDFNNWVAYKTGIIDKKEYERQKDITRKSIAADAVGDLWKNNFGWNEENAQTLKDYSYVTEDNLLGQLSYGLGQQAPALMIGNTQAVQNLMTNPALQSVAGDGAVKNIARGLIRNAPMNAEIGLRSYGGAVEEALQNGATMEQARRYGLLNAGTEIATEWMTGGIPGVENTTGLFDKGVDAVIDKTTGRLKKETSKAIAKSLLSYGFDALGEGLEESVSEILSPLIKNMTYSNGEKIDWNNVLNAGIMGMLQGGILNAPSSVSNLRGDLRNASQQMQNEQLQQQNIEEQSQQIEQIDQLAQQRVQQIEQAVQQGQMTPQEGTQEIEDIQRYVDAQKNTLQQEQQPQQNQNNQLAQQAVQQINQQVQSGQISPQDGIQQIEDIQNYLQAQENTDFDRTIPEIKEPDNKLTTDEFMGLKVNLPGDRAIGFGYPDFGKVAQKNANQIAEMRSDTVNSFINNLQNNKNQTTTNETTQDNINTQEQQNVTQNANNKAEEKQDYEGLNQKEYNEIQRRYKDLMETTGFEEDLIENATPSEIVSQLKTIKEIAYEGDGFLEQARDEGPEIYKQTKSQYDKINRLINRFENKIGQQKQQDNISKQSEAFNLGKNENVETQTEQQQSGNLVEDYMNNGEDNLVNDYMKNYEDGNMVENFMNAQNELQQTQRENIAKQSEAFNLNENKNVEKAQEKEYNKSIKEEGVENEFRRLQEESRRMSSKDTESFHSGQRQVDEGIRNRLSRVLGGRLQAGDGSLWNGNSSIVNKKTGKNIEILENVDPQTFKDTFEIVQKYLPNGDAVDVHDVKSSEYSTGYEDTKNFLSKDGLSGFAITKDGDLISVFNLGEKGYLKSIKDYVKKNGAKTLDCYQSEKQPLADMYNKTLGFKTASLMDFNYDILVEDKGKEYADYFVKTYGEAPVAFMIDTDQNVETKHFNKDQYDEALNYRNSYLKNEGTSDSSFSNEQTNIPETKTEPVVKFDTETKKQTAKQITDVLNKNIKNSENADIFDTIEKDTGKKLRGFVKTATNATGDVDLVSKMDKVKITYDQLPNKEIMKQAENYFKDKSYQDGVEDVLDFIKSDKRVTALDMAKIDYMVLQAKARNDMRTYQTLVEEAGIISTQSGQVSQAVSLIQQSDPMFQLSVLNRIIQKEQENGTKQFKGVKIKEKLVQEVMDSYDENGDFNKEKFDKAMDNLKQDIANQMKVTPMEKADAWRYLSMLGNPKTHIRNVTANVAMKLLQANKNKIAATGEALVDVGSKAIRGKGIQRTKTLMPSTRDVKLYASQTMDNYFKKNNEGSKYNDRITNKKGLKGELLQRRNKFNNKNPFGFLLNLADKGNSALLNLEDNVFNKSAARSAMANYLTANGIRTQADIDAHPDIVQAAFDYGILQGNEATFHQKSTTADVIRQSREKLRTGSGLSKAVGYGIDATMPFVSTPINIAKTGVEYTPGLGLLKTITDVQQAPKAQKASVFIDSLSKQLSGGLLAYAGYLLAKNGWLVGGGDDDSEKKLEKNLGAMNYAIKIGNDYYDVSFLSPSAMPLLMGANLNEALKGKGVKEKVIADVLYQSLDPLTEMSFMSSVQDVLKSYNSGAKGLSDMGSSALTGYISQYIPTLMSQFASSRDEYERSKGGNTFIEKTKQKLMYKVPGLREKLPKQVNVWGEAKENYRRGLEAFLNPMNRSTAKIDDTTKEIEKIYEETGTGMPNMGIKKDQLGNTLNEKEYTQFKKTYGKTAKKELDDLIKSSKYKDASTEEKAAMITKIYSYSTHKSKEEYSKKSGVEYEPQTKYYAMIDAFDIPFNEYVQMGLEDMKADKSSNGKSISGSKKTKVIKAIEESGLTKVQKQAIIKQKGYKTSKNDDYELKREIYSSNLSDEEKNKILEYLKLK